MAGLCSQVYNSHCEGRLLTQYGVDGEHYTREGGTICSEDGVDFARDGFVKVTAAGAEQAETNAVGLDFYNHISFPRRVYGYEGRDPDWPISWRERCSGNRSRRRRPMSSEGCSGTKGAGRLI